MPRWLVVKWYDIWQKIILKFDHLGYVFRDDISSDREYIFERKTVK